MGNYSKVCRKGPLCNAHSHRYLALPGIASIYSILTRTSSLVIDLYRAIASYLYLVRLCVRCSLVGPEFFGSRRVVRSILTAEMFS